MRFCFTNSLCLHTYNKDVVSGLVSLLAGFLVTLFLLGIVGSFVVIVVTFIQDLELLLPDKESTDGVD